MCNPRMYEKIASVQACYANSLFLAVLAKSLNVITLNQYSLVQ
jgi:hypothetical protein